MAILIDTSVFITLERRRLPLRDFFNLIPASEIVGISVMTVSELLAGAHLADSEERRRAREEGVEDLINVMSVLDFNIEAAKVHSVLWADLRRRGQMINPNDIFIAATAVANDYDVLTDNTEHFERISGLKVRKPWWP